MYANPCSIGYDYENISCGVVTDTASEIGFWVMICFLIMFMLLLIVLIVKEIINESN